MSPTGKLWTAAIAAGLIGALIGAGAVWAITQQESASTSADAAQLASIRAELETKDAQITQLTEQVAALTASASVTPTPTSGGATTPSTAREFTFVKAVTAGAKPTITADYAQFLTGKAAADAATAHGDESPPPNDYYIVNDNNKLRTLPVKPGINVKLTAHDDGTSDPAGYTVPFATWAGYYAAPTDNNRSITAGPYWITLTNGVVTKIEEQYTP